jgi:antirestriction protein ArdC
MPITTAETAETGAAVTEKRDFRQEVTDRIVKMLESGVAPWQKPWQAGVGSPGMPMNPTSDRPYRGGNAIHLMAMGIQRGYDDPRWLTYKQAQEHGWQVRRGEKGTQIEFWEVKANRDAGSPSPRGDEDDDHLTEKERPSDAGIFRCGVMPAPYHPREGLVQAAAPGAHQGRSKCRLVIKLRRQELGCDEIDDDQKKEPGYGGLQTILYKMKIPWTSHTRLS